MQNRRNFLRNTTLLAAAATPLVACATPSVAITGKARPTDDGLIGHGDFRYKVDKKWAELNRAQTTITNCHEMVMDQKGRFIMIGDDPRNNVIVFNKDGKVLETWGTMYPGGHGMTLWNAGGEDFLFIAESGWSTDIRTGSGKRQNGFVTKNKIDGTVLFTIGHPVTYGAYTEDMRFQPTETAVAPNGDIYVADGYGSNYILRYNHKGQYIGKFGGSGNADPNYNLAEAHGVAVDLRDAANPKLIVTSRAESAFKYFTLDGKWLKTVKFANLRPCRPVLHGSHVYAGVCWSHNFGESKMDKPWLEQSGFTMVMDENDRVVSCPGGTEPIYKDGVLQQVDQDANKTFYSGHDVCIDDDENVYVCQWNGLRTPPVRLERV